ncbi:hypothetical protein GCM10011351_24450 [Paraliobacillus quinghaiensis]|uniref:Uncharacterized protein n=1 Tax=Paraliobacillus quinghaiensis TaxID=470815 RepID=A0A917WWW4_9BACI|nr:hypothetical protein GCM10011351_24450 [Paraliobacillus quinghaiensis]
MRLQRSDKDDFNLWSYRFKSKSSRRGFTAPTSHTTVRTDPYTAVQPFEYLIW